MPVNRTAPAARRGPVSQHEHQMIMIGRGFRWGQVLPVSPPTATAIASTLCQQLLEQHGDNLLHHGERILDVARQRGLPVILVIAQIADGVELVERARREPGDGACRLQRLNVMSIGRGATPAFRAQEREAQVELPSL